MRCMLESRAWFTTLPTVEPGVVLESSWQTNCREGGVCTPLALEVAGVVFQTHFLQTRLPKNPCAATVSSRLASLALEIALITSSFTASRLPKELLRSWYAAP